MGGGDGVVGRGREGSGKWTPTTFHCVAPEDHDDGLLLVLSYYHTHHDRTQRLGVCARLWRASARCNRKYYVLGDTSRCPLV